MAIHWLEELISMMRRDAERALARLHRKKYINTALLIIDEVGSEPMSRHEGRLLFRLVSHRYQRGSILITTNKDIKDWPEPLAGDEVLAKAILDRPLHNSHVLNVKGHSYRLRDLERGAPSRAEPLREDGCRQREAREAKTLAYRQIRGRRVSESGCRLRARIWGALDTHVPCVRFMPVLGS